MINITDKHNCCGCEACAQRCPKQCIRMKMDIEGFLYPIINNYLCINCSLCEKVCPVINMPSHKEHLSVLAAKSKDQEILKNSSSGGIFTLISFYVLEQGGVVFGAKFDGEWNVVHDYVDTKDKLDELRRSKYVQSKIGDTYKKAEEFLMKGKLVFYTGTPCQINGLKLFLRKEYSNLLTMSILCHGVPSPKLWQDYINDIKKSNIGKEIKSINFRDKTNGWINYNFNMILYDCNKRSDSNIIMPYRKNIFMKAFLQNLILRPSCENCIAPINKHLSDITVGDLWGAKEVYSDFYSDNGISILLVNTSLGEWILSKIDIEKIVVELDKVKQFNGGLINSFIPHKKREQYFNNILRANCFSEYTESVLKTVFISKVKNKIINIMKRK